MKVKQDYSLLVYMKKKYAYTKREEQMEVLANALGGKNIGGGTDLTSGDRDQQFYFKNIKDAYTFLDYPTVKEAIKSKYDLVGVS